MNGIELSNNNNNNNKTVFNAMSTSLDKREPDSDTIKMFVGQIPRSMDENDLRKMFEDYGQVYQLTVLRDKATGQSKGCCFVTFYTRDAAMNAQRDLHNLKTLAGMQHPVQMKPADSEKKNVEERKLFVGMISKKCTENDIKVLFAPFGQIEECTILRENGVSKGCAFVTYANKQSAQSAMKNMHHSQTMEGCRSPVVVKVADTQKDKELKKIQQLNNNLLSQGMANIPSVGGIYPQYLTLLQQASAGGNQLGLLGNLVDLNNLQNLQNLQGLAVLANLANNPSALSAVSGVQNLQALNQLATVGNISSSTNMQGITTSGSISSPTNSTASLNGAAAMNVSTGNLTNLSGLTPTSVNGLTNGSLSTSSNNMEALYSGIQQYAATFPNALTAQSAAQMQQQKALTENPAGKQTEGPEGANLFIYHLPQEYTDIDLLQIFLPFGNVVSSKVFIDKQTKLSKCFGFVSYDNPVSALAAIQNMNGFQIGMKRLKVQLKRPKGDSKPY